MNRLKTKEEKQLEIYEQRMKEYKKNSLGVEWFWGIIAVALILTALIENI